MIIFPASGVFMDLGTMGVSMFFVSYVFYLLELTFTFDNCVVPLSLSLSIPLVHLVLPVRMAA
jgi:hypothetical protein